MKKVMIILALLVSAPALAALSANDIWQLDHQFGPIAHKIALGTQLHAIELVTNGVLADGKIFVGNGAGVATGVTPSGDVTMTNAGVMAIGTGKVTTGMILNGTIGKVDLSTAILPSHVVKFAGLTPSEADANALVTIAVAGVLDTDIVMANIVGQANAVSIIKSVPTAGTLTFTLSGNGGAGTIISYVVFRAVP